VLFYLISWVGIASKARAGGKAAVRSGGENIQKVVMDVASVQPFLILAMGFSAEAWWTMPLGSVIGWLMMASTTPNVLA